jgi:hypothetical protein
MQGYHRSHQEDGSLLMAPLLPMALLKKLTWRVLMAVVFQRGVLDGAFAVDVAVSWGRLQVVLLV